MEIQASNSLNFFVNIFVDKLIKNGKIIPTLGALKIADIGSGCSTFTSSSSACGDRFKVIFQYAGVLLTWEVLFNSRNPFDPPDFIFIDDAAFQPSMDKLTSLVEWDPNDPNALVNVMKELMHEYHLYQWSLAQHLPVCGQLDSICQLFDLEPTDFDLFVVRRDGYATALSMQILLPITSETLPIFMTKDTTPDSWASLLVTLNDTSSMRNSTGQLTLSPRVEKVLGSAKNMKLNSPTTFNFLHQYVLYVRDFIQKKINLIVTGFEKRKDYIMTFIQKWEGCLIEYDAESFYRVSFLLDRQDFYFVFIIDVPASFPDEQPMFTFQSVYHELADGSPYSQQYRSYPYSPRWLPAEMLERARAFISDSMGNFQQNSLREGYTGRR